MCAASFLAPVPIARRPARAVPRRDAAAAPAMCRARPPHRRRKKVRVHRRYTHRRDGWEWRGASKPNLKWMALFSVDDSVLKAFEMLWSGKSTSVETSIFERVKALGRRVLRSFTHAIERTLYPDTEKELVVEYGLTDPSPEDKTFVHPLTDWEMSSVTYYRDSFGRPVYLQLEGASACLSASDYRDQFDDSPEAAADDSAGPDDSLKPAHSTFNILTNESDPPPNSPPARNLPHSNPRPDDT